jgi:hypothetical protein
MPILRVLGLPQGSPERIKSALGDACAAIADVYGCKVEQVWATWEEIRPGFYVEGRVDASVQPADTHPPIATMTCFEGKSAEQIERILTVAAKALSEGLGIPGNVFMTYVEATSGRVVAGDGVVRR